MSISSEHSADPSDQSLPPGTRLEEFVIERVLGSGGFGITYLAKDARLGRQVVIKENLPVQFCFRDPSTSTVRPRQMQGEDAENFKWSLENFEKEAAMLASLEHPGIVRVLRSFEANGTAYFVMPFIEGTALDEQIKGRTVRGNAFTEEEITGLLWRMLNALDYLHARGIYHRDIKPGNILITDEGVPILIDFGSARQRLSERSLTVMESAGYTPFEQLQTRGKIGPWSDLYALGATLYKAIAGETPPKATDRAFDDPIMPLAGRADLRGRFSRYSETLLSSIDRALAPRIEARWRDASQWQEILRSPTSETSPSATKKERDGSSSATQENSSIEVATGSGPALPPGTNLKDFVIERVLGSGCFGITYLARSSRLVTKVVIKENFPVQFCVRDPESLAVTPRHRNGSTFEGHSRSLNHFKKEAAILASLDHPGIVRVLRVFEAHGTAYIVMPFLIGETLDARIRLRPRLSKSFSGSELRRLTRSILNAMCYLHKRGVFLLNLNPGNILIPADGNPVLIGFGWAHQLIDGPPPTSVLENIHFIPMELLENTGKPGIASDVYALGSTIYKVITGKSPPKAEERIVYDTSKPLATRQDLLGRYSRSFLLTVDKAMAPRIEHRFQTAQAWSEAIEWWWTPVAVGFGILAAVVIAVVVVFS